MSLFSKHSSLKLLTSLSLISVYFILALITYQLAFSSTQLLQPNSTEMPADLGSEECDAEIFDLEAKLTDTSIFPTGGTERSSLELASNDLIAKGFIDPLSPPPDLTV